MDFVVDKANNKVTVNRAFLAPREKIWAAWTKSDILDRWWAPQPWKARTKAMDFKEGGFWLYAMVGPEGEEHWCRTDYTNIAPLSNFSAVDMFCDAHGNPDDDFPKSSWTNTFIHNKNTTTVIVEIKYESLADLEKYIEMGFREGFSAALDNLEKLVS